MLNFKNGVTEQLIGEVMYDKDLKLKREHIKK